MRDLVLILTLIFISITTPCANSASFRVDREHRNNRVRIVVPGELSPQIDKLAQLTLKALETAEARTQLELEEDIEVYFDPLPIEHNGLTTAIPRNRIFVHTEAPTLQSSIGISTHYLFETLIHEWGHMLSIQKHKGVFRPLSWIFGHTSRPNGSWPRWIHEGIAVWTEESIGGRPQSGSIAFDLRQYQEATQRLKRPALSNADLDGQWELDAHSNFRSGQVPYSFGYLIWKELSEKKGDDIVSRFATRSSYSLGLSFRKVFEELDIDITQTFSELQKKWATPFKKEDKRKRLARASEIKGLTVFAGRSAWLESRDEGDPVLVDASQFNKTQQTPWPFDLLRPTKAFSLSENQWIVQVVAKSEWTHNSFHSDRSPTRNRLVYWEKGSASPSCIFDLGERFREAQINETTIAWTRSTEDGHFEILKGLWSSADCSVSKSELIFRSREAFQRISSPWVSSDNKVHFEINIPNQESLVKELLIREDKAQLISQDSISDSANEIIYTQLQTSDTENTKALVFERSQSHWGPLYLEKNRNASYSAKRIPLTTGAWEASLNSRQGAVLVIEKFWDHDEVILFSESDLKKISPSTNTFTWDENSFKSSKEAAIDKNKNEDPSPENQYAIDSIWPHFWIPSVLANEGGWLVAGQSFYSDLSSRWTGSTILGYGSSTQRPFGSSVLSYSHSHKKAWPSLSVFFEYSPRDISFFGIPNQDVQERWATEFTISSRFSLEQRWLGLFSAGYSFNYTGAFGVFGESYSQNPSLRLVIRNPDGIRPADATGLLSNRSSFLYFEQRIRWFEAPEFRTELSLLGKTSPRTRILGQIEAANSETENFPKSFFVWGGLVPLGPSYSESFLNRGFPPQSFAAKQLLRFNSEFIWRIADPHWAFSWNRLRVQSLDLRLIAESITWSSISGKNYRLGHQYASSLGTELDILGSSLHYVNYKLSMGVFRGFGDLGETRFTASFKLGLDL